MQLPLEPQQALYYFYTYSVALPKYRKHTVKLAELPFNVDWSGLILQT